MQHIITLSGSSSRFTKVGLPHKALCQIGGVPAIGHFVKMFPDFDDFETIFLCRSEDVETTNLSDIIREYAPYAKILSISSNTLGPVYSIMQIKDYIDKNKGVFVSYIDTLQKLYLRDIMCLCSDFDGGITYHDFSNPHWRNNKSYCLVSHSHRLATDIIEKYDFSNFDFNTENCGGSSGGYYFKTGGMMLEYFQSLLNSSYRVNNEAYVTMAMKLMIEDGKSIRCLKYPYASLGTPEDMSDYSFWNEWFK
jgi:hypothetical protein